MHHRDYLLTYNHTLTFHPRAGAGHSKQTFPAGYFNGNRKAEKLKAYERMIDEKISKVDLSYIILETVEQNPMKPIFKRDYKKTISDLKKKILKVLDD